MIVFDLACPCGYEFEGWFRDHADWHRQQERRLLTCPSCGGQEVSKILSPVAIRRGGATPPEPVAPAASAERTVNPALSPPGQAAAALLAELGRYVAQNFEDVGSKLTETALKIHYGVEEARNLRGIATPQEEKLLAQEGICLLKLPVGAGENDKDKN